MSRPRGGREEVRSGALVGEGAQNIAQVCCGFGLAIGNRSEERAWVIELLVAPSTAKARS